MFMTRHCKACKAMMMMMVMIMTLVMAEICKATTIMRMRPMMTIAITVDVYDKALQGM